MSKLRNRGFTLIELLVVIAIIGILAAVVLTSLNSARDKAKDASAQASMSSMRATAEISFSDEGDYSLVCTAVDDLETAVETQANTPTCHADADGYSVNVVLNNGDTYCVDSSGFAGVTTATIADGDLCDGTPW